MCSLFLPFAPYGCGQGPGGPGPGFPLRPVAVQLAVKVVTVLQTLVSTVVSFYGRYYVVLLGPRLVQSVELGLRRAMKSCNVG